MRLKALVKTSALGRGLLLPYRLQRAMRPTVAYARVVCRWLMRSGEFSNFSYSISAPSRYQLAQLVALSSRTRLGQSLRYVDELAGSAADPLRRHIQGATRESSFRWSEDTTGLFEQRLIYYVLTRAMKPKLVFQSGTARGVGACLVSAALARNAEEGYEGQLVSTDIDPSQGYLVKGAFASRAQLMFRDSSLVLREDARPVDLYLHDSTGGEQLERELAALAPRLAPAGMLLSTWHSARLEQWARERGRSYLIWQDTPADHWYKGATMGLVGRSDI